VWRAPFARPLLEVTRREILTYLRRRSLPFVEDPSNRDLRYARARLRHRILPLLREENPRVDEALRRLAAGAAARPVVSGSGLHGDIPARVASQVARAARVARGTKGFDVPGHRRIVVTYGRVSIIEPSEGSHDSGKETSATSEENGTLATPVQIDGAGEFFCGPGASVCVQEHRAARQPEGGGLAWFDGDRLAWPLSLRHRRPGDRMRPRRGRGTRKVADLMIDAKIPLVQRNLTPVVAAADGSLLFVAGLRPSAVGEPGPDTRRWIGFALRPPAEDVG
jgi:tRNA(Ile)-lysidine synthetase-like protein